MVGTIEILDNQVLAELENWVKTHKVKIDWSSKKAEKKVNGTTADPSGLLEKKDLADMTDAELKLVLVYFKAKMAKKMAKNEKFEDSVEGIKLDLAIRRAEKILLRLPRISFAGIMSAERATELQTEINRQRDEE